MLYAEETSYNWDMQKSQLLIIFLLVCLLTLIGCSNARVAEAGDIVAVHYTGTLDNGEQFDSSRDKEPLSFTIGGGQMIAGFDAAVHGMKVGESITVRIEPEDAYGERREDLIIEFPIAQLPDGLGDGDAVFFQSGATGVILEVTSENFKVDVNHRLAGQALNFEIELVSIE